MKKFIQLSFVLLASGAILFTACKKDKDEATADTSSTPGIVLNDFTKNIAEANLTDLASKASLLNDAISAFVASPSSAGLQSVQQNWYATRTIWEQSEAFLFGPVATMELDPAIDSWPVNFVDIDSVINNNGNVFTESFIDSLNPTLKGFHPIEYLAFGQNGNRDYTTLTARQKEYMLALGSHLKRITAQMIFEWKADGGNYSGHVKGAGQSGSQFATQQEAVLEIANGIIGIIDEVGSGKIEEPFATKDATLEESPFAKNSWTDFKNNLTGAKNVYMGKYLLEGKGMKDLVQQYNKSLDLQIQQKLDAAIQNLGSYTTPFGESIINQPAAVLATQTQLADLKDLLENELIPLIQHNVK
jgi:putative iron-regulated protein